MALTIFENRISDRTGETSRKCFSESLPASDFLSA
jgi:hypothetical protein